MEFDKSRVYTAVNADELKIGSLIIAALNLEKLECQVKSEMDIQKLEKIAGIDCGERFGVDIYHDKNNLRYYPLAYLIKPPAEPKYKPFSSIEKAFEAVKKHGWWVKEKRDGDLNLISRIGKISDNMLPKTDSMLSICVGSTYYTATTFLEDFIFADDGSPCGELVEE